MVALTANAVPVIVVSGLPRSGTSLMMNMLRAGGMPTVTDEMRTADDDNPRGYFELERVKQLAKGDVAWVESARGQAVKVISALLEHLPPTSTYQVLFMQRWLPEVLASQRKMLERRGEPTDTIPDQQMAALFDRHLPEDRGLAGGPAEYLGAVHTVPGAGRTARRPAQSDHPFPRPRPRPRGDARGGRSVALS